MRIQHNISALNSHRNLGINNAGTSKNLEKLSSGFRINRAGDDAAGLAISEKMRGQIRGLEMAEQNTSNGINLIQTAEGGLNETHSILQRMRELAVQSSNGTYQNVDREQLTKEFEALKSEVDRIAESTHYNGIKLLNGNLSNELGAKVTDADSLLAGGVTMGDGTYTDGQEIAIAASGYDAGTPGTDGTKGSTTLAAFALPVDTAIGTDDNGKLTFDLGSMTGIEVALESADDSASIQAKMVTAINTAAAAADKKITASVESGQIVITATEVGVVNDAVALSVSNMAINPGTGGTPAAGTLAATLTGTPVDGTDGTPGTPPTVTVTFDGAATTATYNAESDAFEVEAADGTKFSISNTALAAGATEATVTMKAGKGLVFQIGANGGDDQRVDLNVDNMASTNIGMREGDIKSDGTAAEAGEVAMLSEAHIDTIDNANKAIDIISAATNQVSTQRAELGALQNRLEHTMNNLGVTKENLTAAEATIRDVDMAKEMMDFTKNSILIQASQAMLAQANQLPQGVLQLLR